MSNNIALEEYNLAKDKKISKLLYYKAAEIKKNRMQDVNYCQIGPLQVNVKSVKYIS